MAKGLTSLSIRALRAEGYHRDGAVRGLYVQVTKSTKGGVTKSWLHRFTSPATGGERWMGLGSCDVIGLAEARDLAKAARRLVTLGRDPIEHRRQTLQAERDALAREQASRMTFRQCAEAYAEAHFSKFKNDKHRRQWRTSLNSASVSFGDVGVANIDTAMITKLLEPIWRRTGVTGMRMRGRIEKVLDWATVHKFRQGENPARWKGHLEYVFAAKPKPEAHAAMPFAEIPEFLVRLSKVNRTSARALEFIVFTATRKGEAINATWDEIDFDLRLWTIPEARMKAEREHVVPLSDQALALLAALPRTGRFVFEGDIKGKRVGETGLLKHMGRLAPGFTVHGFRSSFRDWAGEKTNFDREVIEHALAHQLPDKVEAAYRRGTAIEKRRRLMEAWAQYCSTPATRGKEVALHG
jgi:integrase